MASWLGSFFTGLTQQTTDTTNGTFAGVGQTTPSTLDYTSPTYGVGTTVPSGGWVSTTTGTTNITTAGLGNPAMGVYNPNQYTTFTSTGTYNPGTIHIAGPNPSFTTDKGKIDLNELIGIVETLKERLLILTPNFEKMEKYAALKKAYDHYKLMESMIGDEDGQK